MNDEETQGSEGEGEGLDYAALGKVAAESYERNHAALPTDEAWAAVARDVVAAVAETEGLAYIAPAPLDSPPPPNPGGSSRDDGSGDGSGGGGTV